MEQELRLKRKAAERAFEAQAEKDRTLMRLEELRFLATSTKDLDDDAYWIKKQKRLIKNKMRNDLGDEDEWFYENKEVGGVIWCYDKESGVGVMLIVSHIGGLDLSNLAIILNWLKKIHSKRLTSDTNRMIKVLPPKTVKEVVARERERKARTTLLMALPEDHLAKFHKMADEKEMWGLHKGYDRFQTLMIQLEIHGAGVSHEDANQKFLRSLPSSWSQVALIMRTKPSTNDVSTAYSVSSPFVSKSQKEGSSSYTDEVIHFFFANQSSAPQLDYDDLEQINDNDMEEMDLKWQTKVECFNCHKMRHFARDCRAKGNQDSRRRDVGYNGNKARDKGGRPVYQDDSKALVTINGEDIDWSRHIEEYTQNYAMMAYSSSNSGSDNEEYELDSDNDLVSNEQESIEKPSFAFTDSVKHVKTFRENVKETSTPNHCPKVEKQDRNGHTRKGLGYAFTRKTCFVCGSFSHLIRDCDFHEKRMAKQAELAKSKNKSVFMNKESDLEDTPVNDRYADGMHAVPPPMTGNYMPSGHDVDIDYSKTTYGPKQTSVVESDSKPSEYAFCESDSSVETTTSMPAPVDNAPKVVCEPKMWTDAPIIEEPMVPVSYGLEWWKSWGVVWSSGEWQETWEWRVAGVTGKGYR
nr:hypothetical protein [Tanacetum cinerariifolium]